nr:hypothetical protein BdHM001_10120 [Bdellovibrio sp. HM001]
MPFQQFGFLGQTAQQYISKHRSEHAELFKIADELNEIAQGFIPLLAIKSDDIQQLTCVSLYIRIMSSYSSAIKLLEYGLSLDAGNVIRSAVESSIYLNACATNTEFVDSYHYSKEIFRLKMINISLNGEDGAIPVTEENKATLLAIKEEIEGLKKVGKVKELNLREVAKSCEMLPVYNTAYRLLSNQNSHSSSESLKQIQKRDASGNITGIMWQPDLEEIGLYISTLGTALLSGFYGLIKVLAIPKEDLKPLEVKMEKCWDRMQEAWPER